MDALLSFVQMPSGVPVATMAINGAKNAALSQSDSFRKISGAGRKLAEHRATMREEVRAKGEKLASMRGVPAQEFKDLHL